MLNKNLEILLQSINACGNLQGIRLAYGLSKNKKLITAELETLREAIKPTDEFIKYDKERVEVCKTHADKENGEPKMKDNNFIISDKTKFDKEIEKLNQEHKEAVDKRKEQLEEFKELLEQENSLQLFFIKKEDVPKDITVAQLDGIIELIEEKEEKI